MEGNQKAIELALKYHQELQLQDYKFIEKQTGLNKETVKHFSLGKKDSYLSIPIQNNIGRIVGLKYHKIADCSGEKAYWEQGADTEPKTFLFNLNEALKQKEIIICEGEKDCFNLIQRGFNATTFVTGKGTKNPDWQAKAFHEKDVVIIYDNDAENEAKDLAQTLSGIVASIKIIKLPEDLGEKGDVTDYFMTAKKTSEDLRLLIESTAAYLHEGFVKEADSGYEYGFHGLNFYVSDVKIEKGEVSAVVELSKSGKLIHKTLTNLTTEKKRTEFENKAVQRCSDLKEFDEDLIAQALMNIEVDLLTRIKRRPNQSEAESKRKIVPLTEEEAQLAQEFLKSPDLLKHILKDIEAMGYVGENENKLIAYLIATSRKMQTPLAVVVKAKSAAGKSELIKLVLKLMPEEDIEEFTSASEHAFPYLSKDQSHKIFVIAESCGVNPYSHARLYTRELVSKGSINRMSVVKSSDGSLATKNMEVHGPVALFETTTMESIHEENETRMMTLTVDESGEQTRRIQTLQNFSYTEEYDSIFSRKDEIVRRHKCLQRYLKNVDVKIPFANHIAPFTDLVRGRRDHKKLLDLIATIAFIHQEQRLTKVVNDGLRVYAEISDYEIAYNLISHVLNNFGELNKHSLELLQEIKEFVAKNKKNENSRPNTFTHSDIIQHTKREPSEVKQRMKALLKQELVQYAEKGVRGASHRFKLSHSEANSGLRSLLSPQDLEVRWKSAIQSEVPIKKPKFKIKEPTNTTFTGDNQTKLNGSQPVKVEMG